MYITIDAAIAKLQKAKKAIGGDKVLIVSLTGSTLELSDQVNLVTIDENESKYVEVRVDGYRWVADHIRYE